MKKLGLFITILLAISLSLSASGQLFTLGFDSGWSSAFEGPYMGMHTFYHFGANLDQASRSYVIHAIMPFPPPLSPA